MTYFLFILLGFVLGSTLFAYWIPRLFFKTDITKVPPDHNPGVANAYMQAGFFAGTLSLLCELFKGAVPVFLADRILDLSWQLQYSATLFHFSKKKEAAKRLPSLSEL